MKHNTIRLIAASLIFSTFVWTTASAQELKNQADSVSYAMGMLMGKNLKKQDMNDLNLDILILGMADLIENKGTKKSPQQADEIFRSFSAQKQKERKAMEEATYAKIKSDGEAFLAANAERENVVSLPSGLQYEVLQEGDGIQPNATDKVTTHYHGTLVDGTVFDSSVDRGEPISFPLNGVIQAWQEALPLMKVGSKWRIYAPYNLAYGERGAGGVIKPYSALIFEIELLGVND